MAGPRADTWMPWYVGDYLADTTHLTTELHGAYCLLLMATWKRRGVLVDDDEELAAIAKLPLARWRQVRARLARFFQVADGEWRQKRVTAELEKANRITTERQNAGKRGGKITANARQTTRQTVQQNPTPSPSRSQSPDSAAEAEPDAAQPSPAAHVAAAFAAKHRALWPDFEAFRQLRRWPGPLLPDIQLWLDRGLSAAHLTATLDAALERWRGDAEPPKGIRPFQRELDEAVALARAGGGVTASDDARLAYLAAFIAQRGRDDAQGPAWFPEWGARPASLDAARAEHAALAAKQTRDGAAA